MKKFFILIIAVFSLCSCSKDDSFNTTVDQNTTCCAEIFFNYYYDDPIPCYEIQSLNIKDYQWGIKSESGNDIGSDANLITIEWYDNNKNCKNVSNIGKQLKELNSPDYIHITYNCLQIICMHKKTRGYYNKYIK